MSAQNIGHKKSNLEQKLKYYYEKIKIHFVYRSYSLHIYTEYFKQNIAIVTKVLDSQHKLYEMLIFQGKSCLGFNFST